MLSTRITFNKPISKEKNLKFHISVVFFHIEQLKISKFDKMESQVFYLEKENKKYVS